MFDTVLTTDIKVLILTTYAASYTPLLELACQRWRTYVHEHRLRHIVATPQSNNSAVVIDDPVLRELCSRPPFQDLPTLQDIIMFMLGEKHRERPTPIQSILVELAERGHVDLFSWILRSRTRPMSNNDRVDAPTTLPNHMQVAVMLRAACCGQTDFLEFCHTLWDPQQQISQDELDAWSIRSIEAVMIAAARGGHEALMRLCYNRWDKKYSLVPDVAMALAARKGHAHLVRICHDELRATNVDWALIRAARGGHEGLLRMIHDEWKATNVDKAMVAAAQGGHEHIVRLCHDTWGATDVDGVFVAALQYGHTHVARVCWNEWGARGDAIERIRQRILAGHSDFDEVDIILASWSL